MAHHDVLLLNANYEPLNVCNLRRAVTLLVLGKAEIIQDTENIVLTSSGTLIVPSIVRMRYQVKRPMPQLRLSRHSVLARDQYTCQYCGSARDLTIDHVIPRWVGGPHSWDNLVACCRKCNLKKGDKTPQQAGMKLKKQPKRPSYVPYLSLQKYMKAVTREDWHFYLPVFEEFKIAH
ncbi:HNH endonuclease [Kamptonema cortianum]|nr:HNH endonuclease [Geitlerinema splendidum]MDK3158793.1 HNH endonuclease [Kamptonema cortianum]